MKNIPNLITISRVILIGVFVILASFDNNPDNYSCIHVSAHTAYVCHVIALIVAFIAALTDLLDGYLARKLHLESDFGRLIDPLADKIFVLATLSAMVAYAMLPAWFLVVILAREFMVTGLRSLASAKGVVIAADRWGKLKTALQMTMLAVGGASWISLFGFNLEASPVTKIIWYALMSVVALITITSGLGYFIRHRSLYMGSLEV